MSLVEGICPKSQNAKQSIFSSQKQNFFRICTSKTERFFGNKKQIKATNWRSKQLQGPFWEAFYLDTFRQWKTKS
jgi:hypothetical protein